MKKPGDPLNLVVVGNSDQILNAFKQAGWTEAKKLGTQLGGRNGARHGQRRMAMEQAPSPNSTCSAAPRTWPSKRC